MADELSMALMELLRKAELDQDVDFLREGVRTLSQALMELEVSQALGSRAPRTHTRTHGAAQWLSGAAVGHTSRHGPATGAAGPRWQLLSGPPGATSTCRAGAGGRDSGGVCARRLDAPSR